MKKAILGALAALVAVLALVSCGGSSPGDDPRVDPTPPVTPTASAITGNVVNSSTGAPLSAISVTAGSQSTTTNSNGDFTLNSTAGTAVVVFRSNNFALQSRNVAVTSGATSLIAVQMVPVALTSTPFSPATAQSLTVPGTTFSQVDLTANSLRTSTGVTPSGQVTARVTPISLLANPGLVPGEFTVSAGGGTSQVESFGALTTTFTDANGSALNLAPGTTATIRIPVSGRGTPPNQIDLMYFNTTTGLWVPDGTATLMGAAPNQFYQGTVTHFTTWAVTQIYGGTATILGGAAGGPVVGGAGGPATPLLSTNVSVCVQDSAGARVSGVRVTADGISYSGTHAGTTDSQGNTTVQVRRSGGAAITATSGSRVSNTAAVTSSQTTGATFTLTPCLVLPTLSTGNNIGNITIKLTWGTNPSDLDSHLRGPNLLQVAFYDRGSLTSGAFANLDVDDVTSFGPEIVTISRVSRGTYRYFVHNWSRSVGSSTAGMTSSPARVEVRSGTQTQIFSPSSAFPSENVSSLYWHVFNILVDSNCNVTIQPVNQFVGSEPFVTGSGLQCSTAVQPSKPEQDEYEARVQRSKAAAAELKP